MVWCGGSPQRTALRPDPSKPPLQGHRHWLPLPAELLGWWFPLPAPGPGGSFEGAELCPAQGPTRCSKAAGPRSSPDTPGDAGRRKSPNTSGAGAPHPSLSCQKTPTTPAHLAPLPCTSFKPTVSTQPLAKALALPPLPLGMRGDSLAVKQTPRHGFTISTVQLQP